MGIIEIFLYILVIIFLIILISLLTLSLVRLRTTPFYLKDPFSTHAHNLGYTALWIAWILLVLLILFLLWFFPRMDKEMNHYSSRDWLIFIFIGLGLLLSFLLVITKNNLETSPYYFDIIDFGIFHPLMVSIVLSIFILFLLSIFVVDYIIIKSRHSSKN